ncbi:hypothetical protein DQ04_01231130 [Trypanosoma grayi]|uniref:hypothetical protein n=1 Tax=Trypanosoma grayi TaxID=71804 RepID=UPI0004F413E3|nr:hypothetical protein DQ04_01231130 [Trypanosoma grayi]KEG13078.1 hypothetical protein DQ04_01231130 [Trypanosoma grayi]
MSASNATTEKAYTHVLQLENDALRRQVQQAHLEVERLAQIILYKPKNTRRGDPGADAAHVARLERRCEQLASRLVCLVRDRQLSECAEIHFLLRTQEEERRFLRDALVKLLKKCKGYTPGENEEWQMDDGIHPGTLSALIIRVADCMQSDEAQWKLEQAERLVAIDQTTNFIVDIQQAVERAARLVYNCHFDPSHVASRERLQTWRNLHNNNNNNAAKKTHAIMCNTSDRPPLYSLQSQRSGIQTTQSCYGDANNYIELMSSSSCDVDAVEAAAAAAAGMGQRQGGLLEACDVLRACHRALEDVRRLLGGAASTRATAQTNGMSSVEQLLAGFQRDLQELMRSCATSRETLARRLSTEIEAHRQTVQKYEARLKLVERELVDVVTGAPQTSQLQPQVPLGTNIAGTLFPRGCSDKETEMYIPSAGSGRRFQPAVDTPPPTSGNLPSLYGETVRRESKPERIVAPPHGGNQAMRRIGGSDWRREQGDNPYVSAADAAAFVIDGIGASKGAASSPEWVKKKRFVPHPPNTLDTWSESLDESTYEGSVAHSPPPPSHRRGSPRANRAGYLKADSPRSQTAPPPRRRVFSPSVY